MIIEDPALSKLNLDELLSPAFNEAIRLINNSNLRKIKKLKDYVAKEINFNYVPLGFLINNFQRLKKNEPIDLYIGDFYLDFITSGEELVPAEMLFTALHELFENALLLKHHGRGAFKSKWCPKANALAGLVLTGSLDESIRDYIHEEWGLVSYLPDSRTPEGRLELEFLGEMMNKFNISKEKAYVYLATYTRLSRSINYKINDLKEYVKGIKI